MPQFSSASDQLFPQKKVRLGSSGSNVGLSVGRGVMDGPIVGK